MAARRGDADAADTDELAAWGWTAALTAFESQRVRRSEERLYLIERWQTRKPYGDD